MHSILERVGKRIRNERKKNNLTIGELAKQAGLSEKYLQGVEVGKRNISIVNLAKIADSLTIDVEELVRQTPDKNSSEGLPISENTELDEKINQLTQRINNLNPMHVDMFSEFVTYLERINASDTNSNTHTSN